MRKIVLNNGNLKLSDEVVFFYEKTVTPFGNGAKIDAPKDFLGRKVYVMICKGDKDR